jgi:hypothetical protein
MKNIKTILTIAVVFTVLLLAACAGGEETQNPITASDLAQEPPQEEANDSAEFEELNLQIAQASDDLLSAFSHLHEFNYTHINDPQFDGYKTDLDLVVWANVPLRDFAMLSFGNDTLDDELIFIPLDTFGQIDELMPGHAFVINSYYTIGTLPWSGVTFIDESGLRRYFAINEGWSDEGEGESESEFHIWEFENKTHELPSDWTPWWEEEYQTDGIPSSGYIALSYLGVLRDPQHGAAGRYDVWNDQDFVDNVWSELNYEAWTEMEHDFEPYTRELLFITFHTGVADPLKFMIGSSDIASNEFGWSGLEQHDEVEVIYYDMPSGTFERIYNILTNYSLIHSVADMNLDRVRELSRSGGIMRFTISNEPVTFVNLLTSDAGDFVAQWELELWEPHVMSDELLNLLDSANPSREVVTIRGIEFEGTIGIDRVYFTSSIIDGVHLAGIGLWSGTGSGNLYKIPDHVYHRIQEQFNGFKEISTLEEFNILG